MTRLRQAAGRSIVLFAALCASAPNSADAQTAQAEMAALFPALPWDHESQAALSARVVAFGQRASGIGCVSIVFSQYPCASAWRFGIGPYFSEAWRAEFTQQNGRDRRFANQLTAPRTGISGEHLGAEPAGESLLGRLRPDRGRRQSADPIRRISAH